MLLSGSFLSPLDYCDTQGGSSGSPVLSAKTDQVISLHHCRGDSACTQTGADPNRAVPILLIRNEIAGIIASSTPAPTMATPAPTPIPTQACITDTALFQVKITPDLYPGEITWRLTTCDGTLVESGGPYTTSNDIFFNACINVFETYVFTIFDSFGDGICCLFGIGSYTVTVS